MVEKLVPKLRFNEFHDGWNTIFLNNILSFKNGFNASKDQYGFGTKFINVSDILENNYLTYDNIKDYVNVDENELSNYIIEYGDIVFQRSSENREEVGTANVYLGSQPCVYGGFVIRGKKEGNYNPFFLKELLQSTRVRKEITSWSGGSTRYNIGQDSLNKISVSLPSIEEQNKIADLLLKVYEKIDLLNYKFQCYNNFKKYLMQQIFTQKLRFADYTDEWKTIKLKDIGEINTGNTPSTAVDEYYSPKKYLWVTPSDISKKYIFNTAKGLSDEGAKKGRFVKKNSVLVTCIASIGKNCIILEDGYFNQQINSITPSQSFDLEFIYYLIDYNSEKMKNYAGITATPILNKKSFENMKFEFPSFDEQKQIGDILSKVDNKIFSIEKMINNTQKYKKGLLQQMFI